MDIKILYKYKFDLEKEFSQDKKYLGIKPVVVLQKFKVLNETDTHYLINYPKQDGSSRTRWVNKDGRKLAYQTKEQALEIFIRNRTREIENFHNKISLLKDVIKMADVTRS